jgi:riboflavin kinase/FMN adenylyltransferase
LLNLSPGEFIDSLVRRFAPSWIVEGGDFRFGRDREGSADALIELGHTRGFGVQIVPPRAVALSDHLVVPASSTLVRWLLENGRVLDASLSLDRPYEVRGTVVRGDRRGRTIGFPTANLQPETTPPADGVYAGMATLEDGRTFPCMLNIGTRPTFSRVEFRFEVHLIGAPAESDRIAGLPEYEWSLRIEFLAWIRDQVRFASVAQLVDQLNRDRERALWHAAHPPVAPPQPPVVSTQDFTSYSRRAATA